MHLSETLETILHMGLGTNVTTAKKAVSVQHTSLEVKAISARWRFVFTLLVLYTSIHAFAWYQ